MDGANLTCAFHMPYSSSLRGGSGYDTCAVLLGPEFDRGNDISKSYLL